jgi:hypothetical protein
MQGLALLNRPVVTRGIELGRVVDVILDEAELVIGLDYRFRGRALRSPL